MIGQINAAAFRRADILGMACSLRQEYCRGNVKELGELADVGLAEFPLAVQDQGGDGARTEDGGEVRRPQVALFHEELDHADGIDRRKRVGALIVFFYEGGKKGMERNFLRACGAVLNRSAQ